MVRTSATLRAALFAWVALALGPVAGLAQGLALGWQDCRPPTGTGFGNQGFGCTSNIVEIPLFPSFTLATPVDSVHALELVIDVDVAADPLPEWWRMDPGQCRANGWSANTSLAGSCADPWGGQGAASFQGWLPGTPGGSGRHGRLLVTAGVLPAQAVSLAALTAYTACRVILRTINSTTCAGCSVPACLVLNSILLRRLPGSSVEEVLIGVAESPGVNFVAWQGGSGADCQSVPGRRSTWGAVKALYR
jgi:hypothetical protein